MWRDLVGGSLVRCGRGGVLATLRNSVQQVREGRQRRAWDTPGAAHRDRVLGAIVCSLLNAVVGLPPRKSVEGV